MHRVRIPLKFNDAQLTFRFQISAELTFEK